MINESLTGANSWPLRGGYFNNWEAFLEDHANLKIIPDFDTEIIQRPLCADACSKFPDMYWALWTADLKCICVKLYTLKLNHETLEDGDDYEKASDRWCYTYSFSGHAIIMMTNNHPGLFSK